MAQWMLAQQECSLLLPMRSFSGLPPLLLWCCSPSYPLLLAGCHPHFSSPLHLIRRVNWLAAPPPPWSWVGGWGGREGNGGRWEWKRVRDELSLGSHLALSCYFWGVALSPLLDSGKSMATLWQGKKHGVSWNWLEIVAVAVHPRLYPTARLCTAFS